MNVREYLQTKYGKNKPTTITSIEAEAFGIPFPLTAGWLDRYGGIFITPGMQIYVERMMNKRIAKANKKGTKRLSYAQKSLDVLKSGPVTIVKPGSVRVDAMPPKQKYVDPNSPEFLTSYAWRTIRMQALKQHGAVCMCCGDTPKNGAIMNVDHIKPRKHFPHLALRLDNLQILCGACNQGKANWDETDWRDSDPASQEGLTGYELSEISKILSTF